MFRRLAPYVGVLGAGGAGLLVYGSPSLFGRQQEEYGPVPARSEQIDSLRKATRDNPFDVLIIGGGATGAGCALDATTRGLRTALIERDDFASGTSSKSTKLVHGGVRYLEKAVFGLDYGQLKLVYEALHERKALLDNAPHLASPLPILMPCYKWWEVPFFWAGLKTYDLIAGTRNLGWSKLLFAQEAVRAMPTLADHRADGRSLKASVLYYDGQFDDARLNVALACSAAASGAAVANHVEAVRLIKDPGTGRVVGARLRDKQGGGRDFDVYARVVLNTTGPFVDGVRQMANPMAAPIVQPSSGAHVTLPEWYGGSSVGMIIPKTKDGRVVFVLPWQGAIIAGTTDAPCKVDAHPVASAEEVSFILDAISDFLNIKVREQDVLSAWSGIRPLAADPTATDTASVSRDHIIFEDADGVITVTGGKWTTYRLMAQDAIDRALATGQLPAARGCRTHHLRLIGAQQHRPTMHAEVAQGGGDILQGRASISAATARHLAAAYGDRAFDVLRLAAQGGGGAGAGLARPLVPGHPFLEAEVVYACRHEYAGSVEDFLARRIRLAFLDAGAALEAIPKVADLMAAELGWGYTRKRREVYAARAAILQFKPVPLPPAPEPPAAAA